MKNYMQNQLFLLSVYRFIFRIFPEKCEVIYIRDGCRLKNLDCCKTSISSLFICHSLENIFLPRLGEWCGDR
jgi:hypothetical protein